MTRHDDDAFTLIELLVVVMVIGVLLAVGTPTLLGARDAANDRAAQSNLRNANTNAIAFYSNGSQRFTQDPLAMAALDSSLEYTNALGAIASNVLYLEVPLAGTHRPEDTLYIA